MGNSREGIQAGGAALKPKEAFEKETEGVVVKANGVAVLESEQREPIFDLDDDGEPFVC